MKNHNKRNIDFLFEIGTLKNVQRGWRQHLDMDCATVLEHTMRVIWIALIISRMENAGDENKIIRMAMVHDLPETRTSDLGYMQKIYVKADDALAANDLFSNTILKDFYDNEFRNYEDRNCVESKIVKDADNLDVDIELKEFEERGSKLPKKWKDIRKMVRDKKLYTNSAKELWDLLQKVDVSDWHLKANKWIKMPEAGY
ncbi:HD domain-containing protein [Candidatus Parcubacteria bacterium]|nr:HD domain-containing protein [Candidatus Parcubacteria bacterium]